MAIDPISAVSGLIETAVNKIWPDKTEQEKAKAALLMTELQQGFQLILGQIDVNKTEAAHTSVFVAGWRPFVGWTCGSSLAWTFVVGPMLSFFTGWPIPILDMGELMTILLGILGLGAYRSYEKKTGTEGNR